MNWSETAWDAASKVFEAIKRLPFLKELADGTLSPERFHFYISQDSLYLNVYSRVLAHIASRLPDMADVETMLRFAGNGVAVENTLHAGFNPDLSMGMSKICLFYTSVLKSFAEEDVAVEAAAVLPCFWVYHRVGEFVLSIAKIDGNPYREWIATYADESFKESTLKTIEICDRLAQKASQDTRSRMTDAFVTCCRLEWHFWDSAYKTELWDKELC